MSSSEQVTVQDSAAPTLGEAATHLFTPEEKAAVQHNVTEARITQAKYLRDHPEVEEILALAMNRLLRKQPTDAEVFLTDFFADNDLEEVLATERATTAEKKRISAEAGEEKMKTLF